MGYVESNLMTGERIVARSQIHWVSFFWPAVIVLIALMMLTGSSESAKAAPGGFLIAAIWGVTAFTNLQTSEFAVTNKRVLIKVGWIRRHSFELLLTKVEGIQVHQGIVGRILGYGSIIVSGTGGAKEPFHRIANPFDFRRRVQEQIEARQVA